ncbi:unnamed protein product [Boreogadus saida]
MAYTHFKDNFWNSDPTGTVGYDVIIQHLNDGRRTCKEVEEFMKARASIEDKYAKDLLGLSRKVFGLNEMNTLKRSLDMFKLQIEHVGQTHLQLAQNMRDEAKKLEDFRERQKDAKKKVEFQMDSLHKQKVLQFRRTLESKKAYEQKCRDKEEADQNVNRNANNTRNIEKLHSKALQAKQNADEADRVYLQNVTSLAKIRNEWLNEHANACEVFEAQVKERINTLRNTVWTHVNQLSQQCVTSDELYEEVRKSLDQCDIKEDIEYFIHLRRTGDKPPAPVLYENFYSSDRNPNAGQFSKSPLPINRRATSPDPGTDDVIYSTLQEPGYSFIQF